MFFGDAGNGTVYQIPAGNMGAVPVSSDFNVPYGLATDREGALYVADTGKSFITKLSIIGFNLFYIYGTPVALGSGFNAPTGIAVDTSSGFIYVADNGNGLLKKMSPDGTTITTIGTGLVKPAGVALDAYGNLYIADNGDNTVKKIAAGSNTATVLASGFGNAFGISIDGGGNIYVADKSRGTIIQIPASGGSKVTVGSGFSGPASVFADDDGIDAGVLYVADTNHGRVYKITPKGGYYISPALPAGLNFDTATGIVSGTPTAVSPFTQYYVYAYNSAGNGWSNFAITVTAPPATMAAREANDAILVHQGLSPNGDGLNDVLKIDGLSAFPDNKLTIMNKGGAVVFEAKNYGHNISTFDGHSNKGQLQKPGDYFYLLEYKAGAQVKRKTGYILLKY
jgi:gliding motility-associated-like protein